MRIKLKKPSKVGRFIRFNAVFAPPPEPPPPPPPEEEEPPPPPPPPSGSINITLVFNTNNTIVLTPSNLGRSFDFNCAGYNATYNVGDAVVVINFGDFDFIEGEYNTLDFYEVTGQNTHIFSANPQSGNQFSIFVTQFPTVNGEYFINVEPTFV